MRARLREAGLNVKGRPSRSVMRRMLVQWLLFFIFVNATSCALADSLREGMRSSRGVYQDILPSFTTNPKPHRPPYDYFRNEINVCVAPGPTGNRYYATGSSARDFDWRQYVHDSYTSAKDFGGGFWDRISQLPSWILAAMSAIGAVSQPIAGALGVGLNTVALTLYSAVIATLALWWCVGMTTFIPENIVKFMLENDDVGKKLSNVIVVCSILWYCSLKIETLYIMWSKKLSREEKSKAIKELSTLSATVTIPFRIAGAFARLVWCVITWPLRAWADYRSRRNIKEILDEPLNAACSEAVSKSVIESKIVSSAVMMDEIGPAFPVRPIYKMQEGSIFTGQRFRVASNYSITNLHALPIGARYVSIAPDAVLYRHAHEQGQVVKCVPYDGKMVGACVGIFSAMPATGSTAEGLLTHVPTVVRKAIGKLRDQDTHICSTDFGHSGSPVVLLNQQLGETKMKAVGVHCAGGEPNVFNYYESFNEMALEIVECCLASVDFWDSFSVELTPELHDMVVLGKTPLPPGTVLQDPSPPKVAETHRNLQWQEYANTYWKVSSHTETSTLAELVAEEAMRKFEADAAKREKFIEKMMAMKDSSIFRQLKRNKLAREKAAKTYGVHQILMADGESRTVLTKQSKDKPVGENQDTLSSVGTIITKLLNVDILLGVKMLRDFVAYDSFNAGGEQAARAEEAAGWIGHYGKLNTKSWEIQQTIADAWAVIEICVDMNKGANERFEKALDSYVPGSALYKIARDLRAKYVAAVERDSKREGFMQTETAQEMLWDDNNIDSILKQHSADVRPRFIATKAVASNPQYLWAPSQPYVWVKGTAADERKALAYMLHKSKRAPPGSLKHLTEKWSSWISMFFVKKEQTTFEKACEYILLERKLGDKAVGADFYNDVSSPKQYNCKKDVLNDEQAKAKLKSYVEQFLSGELPSAGTHQGRLILRLFVKAEQMKEKKYKERAPRAIMIPPLWYEVVVIMLAGPSVVASEQTPEKGPISIGINLSNGGVRRFVNGLVPTPDGEVIVETDMENMDLCDSQDLISGAMSPISDHSCWTMACDLLAGAKFVQLSEGKYDPVTKTCSELGLVEIPDGVMPSGTWLTSWIQSVINACIWKDLQPVARLNCFGDDSLNRLRAVTLEQVQAHFAKYFHKIKDGAVIGSVSADDMTTMRRFSYLAINPIYLPLIGHWVGCASDPDRMMVRYAYRSPQMSTADKLQNCNTGMFYTLYCQPHHTNHHYLAWSKEFDRVKASESCVIEKYSKADIFSAWVGVENAKKAPVEPADELNQFAEVDRHEVRADERTLRLCLTTGKSLKTPVVLKGLAVSSTTPLLPVTPVVEAVPAKTATPTPAVELETKKSKAAEKRRKRIEHEVQLRIDAIRATQKIETAVVGLKPPSIPIPPLDGPVPTKKPLIRTSVEIDKSVDADDEKQRHAPTHEFVHFGAVPGDTSKSNVQCALCASDSHDPVNWVRRMYEVPLTNSTYHQCNNWDRIVFAILQDVINNYGQQVTNRFYRYCQDQYRRILDQLRSEAVARNGQRYEALELEEEKEPNSAVVDMLEYDRDIEPDEFIMPSPRPFSNVNWNSDTIPEPLRNRRDDEARRNRTRVEYRPSPVVVMQNGDDEIAIAEEDVSHYFREDDEKDESLPSLSPVPRELTAQEHIELLRERVEEAARQVTSMEVDLHQDNLNLALQIAADIENITSGSRHTADVESRHAADVYELAQIEPRFQRLVILNPGRDESELADYALRGSPYPASEAFFGKSRTQTACVSFVNSSGFEYRVALATTSEIRIMPPKAKAEQKAAKAVVKAVKAVAKAKTEAPKRTPKEYAAARTQQLVGRGDYLDDIVGVGKDLVGKGIKAGVNWLTDKAAGWLGGLFGMGDYSSRPHKPNANSLWKGSKVPSVRSTSSAPFIFRRREKICDIQSSVGFQTKAISVNPGLPESFPWLSATATSFAQYKLHGAVIEFVSTVAAYGGGDVNGKVLLSTRYDVTQPAPAAVGEIENQEWTVPGRPLDNLLMAIECAPNTRPINVLEIRPGLLPGSAALAMFDHCIVDISNEGQADANIMIGSVYISYEVELLKPIDLNLTTNHVLSDHWKLDGVATSLPMGTSQLLATNSSIGGTVSNVGGTYSFPEWVTSGTFFVVYEGKAGTSFSAGPVFNCVGCTALTIFTNGTSFDSSTGFTFANGPATSGDVVIRIDEPGASFTVNVGTVVGAAMADLFVTLYDGDVATLNGQKKLWKRFDAYEAKEREVMLKLIDVKVEKRFADLMASMRVQQDDPMYFRDPIPAPQSARSTTSSWQSGIAPKR